MNSKQLGNIAIGEAIAYFTSHEYVVSIPLNDSQRYDLVVDEDGQLFKIQVKYTAAQRHGAWVATLKTCGGNKTRSTVKRFDPLECDFLFIVCGDGSRYLLPSEVVKTTSSLSLGKKYSQYQV